NGGNTIGASWAVVTVPAGRWRGPYIDHVPVDPTTGSNFCWNSTYAGAGSALYSCNSSTGSDGTAMNTW
ncbi:MAG: hypothetical protein ABUL49_02090, partial [bacterium]